jgi:phage baseplate assembly protein W
MIKALSPKVPVVYDKTKNGYAMNMTFIELVKQNIKMIILTSPGERIMYPEYGVGLKKFLFQPNVNQVHSEIKTRIASQLRQYLPSINVRDISILTPELSPDLPREYIKIEIYFHIIPLSTDSNLNITFDRDKGTFV